LQIVLQLAARNIGQVTDIEPLLQSGDAIPANMTAITQFQIVCVAAHVSGTTEEWP
jgi:hypothetical protein